MIESFEAFEDDTKVDIVETLLNKLPHMRLSQLLSSVLPLLCRDFISMLPSEIAVKILSYVDARTLVTCESVCKTWRITILESNLWRKQYERLAASNPLWRQLSEERRGELPRGGAVDPAVWKGTFTSFYTQESRIRSNWRRGSCLRTSIPCNGNGIYCLQYDKDKIICGSRDNTIKIWNSRTLECEQILSGHEGSVLCLQFDETKIVSGSSDSTVRVWDRASGRCVATLDNHTQSVLHLRFDESRLVTCSKDRTVIVWRLRPAPPGTDPAMITYEELHVLVGHNAAVNVVEFDKKYIVSASGDRQIKIWATDTGELVKTLKGHERGIACLQYRGRFIVSGSSDETIRVWDVETGLCLQILRGHEGLVRCIRFNDDYIVSGSYDKSIRIWDFKTGEMLNKFEGHQNRVFRVQFDYFKIISSSQDDQICIWDFYSGSLSKPSVMASPSSSTSSLPALGDMSDGATHQYSSSSRIHRV